MLISGQGVQGRLTAWGRERSPAPRETGLLRWVGEEMLSKADPGTLGRGSSTHWDLREAVCGGRSWDELSKEKEDLPEREIGVITADAYFSPIRLLSTILEITWCPILQRGT